MDHLTDPITLSVVSHGQAHLIASLLSDLAKLPQQHFQVLITVNIPEDESAYSGHAFPVRIIRNATPKGFGANHNAAFLQSKTRWFAVINPDIRINSLDFHQLLAPFDNEFVAAVAPLVLSANGKIEDSARRFPTFARLAKRAILRLREPDYSVQQVPYPVDWVAGMFVVYRRDAYIKIEGFDANRFFMYLEDADICFRLKENGFITMLNPNERVIHMAQRASRKNLKHMRWHAVSAFRFLTGL